MELVHVCDRRHREALADLGKNVSLWDFEDINGVKVLSDVSV